jgi:hypothetical protein
MVRSSFRTSAGNGMGAAGAVFRAPAFGRKTVRSSTGGGVGGLSLSLIGICSAQRQNGSVLFAYASVRRPVVVALASHGRQAKVSQQGSKKILK